MTKTPMFSRFSSANARKKAGMSTPHRPAMPGHDGEPTERNQMRIRWFVLVLCCTGMIGNYYCYDNPSALKEQIKERFKGHGYSETNFQLLYSLYSFPNVVLPFFGGVLVDRVGARTALLLFGSFITMGQCLLALGASSKSFTLMLVGRIVFGFGGESLTVAQSAIVSLWFKGRELAFALGVNLSIARLGGTINNQLSPFWANAQGLTFALWFGVIMCGVSITATLILIPIDVAAEKRSKKACLPPGAPAAEAEAVQLSDVRYFNKMLWLLTTSCVVVYGCVLPFNNTASSFLLERDFFRTPKYHFPTNDPTNGKWVCPSGKSCCTGDFSPLIPKAERSGKFVNCSGSPYQPVLPGNMTKVIDCSVDTTHGIPHTDVSSAWYNATLKAADEYCSDKKSAETHAAVIMSIPYFISAIISPFLGFVVDRFGKRAIIATLAPFLLVIVHLMLGLAPSVPGQYPLIGQGLAYSAFAAALWPSVPYVVEDRLVGTAYGVITAVQNLGLATFPLIAASIYQHSGDKYVPNTEFLFVGLAVIGTLIGVWLNIEDPKYGNAMNKVHIAAENSGGDDSMDAPLLGGEDV